jgi:hypothetical protein
MRTVISPGETSLVASAQDRVDFDHRPVSGRALLLGVQRPEGFVPVSAAPPVGSGRGHEILQ